MKNKKAMPWAEFAIVMVILGAGISIYYDKENRLHNLMQKPAIVKIMKWAGVNSGSIPTAKETYWCPMHPQVKRDKAGTCPICNMQLVKIKKDDKKEKSVGSILLTSRQIQEVGVRFATVGRLSFARQIETSGIVAVDERRLKTISVWAPGQSRINTLYANFTGANVKTGEPLLSIYNPAIVTTQEEYLLLLKNGTERMAPLIKSITTRLKGWGMAEKEIEKFRIKGAATDNFTIYSPVSGTVMERLVDEGEYVKEGQALLKLADLSTVWIYGDVYENELPFIKVGTAVEISVNGKGITGKVDFIDPVAQIDSQTVRVRFEIPNKNGYLKPGMFASVRINLPEKDLLAVPASAVLLTGRRAIVMVSEGEGVMRPVDVTLGRKWLYPSNKNSSSGGEERYHEIIAGLETGERIVSSANFLITAEAQFQGVLKKLAPPSTKGETAKLPDDIESAFAHILKSYEKIRKALAQDNTDISKKVAANLIGNINTVINKTDRDLNKMLTELKAETKKITEGPKDIAKTREHFASMSKTIILLIARYGLPEGITLNAFTCPMTDNDDVWLQPGKTIDNPYMGQKMATCGISFSLTGMK
ncbi:Probable Co/Zn/Cd efflux system membrane fusion protein [hydrothermal vent metagenome]|uniref:Probable Co/Zn/Cd efflux system membrane fusion protein n=1 Tax=hydrothermal vent metagenome TaxID=652676 RepID=A0A3B1BYA6_9ZZZZ